MKNTGSTGQNMGVPAANYSLEVKHSAQKELDALENGLFARVDRTVSNPLSERHLIPLQIVNRQSSIGNSSSAVQGAFGANRHR